jgi:purine nucleoside permease
VGFGREAISQQILESRMKTHRVMAVLFTVVLSIGFVIPAEAAVDEEEPFAVKVFVIAMFGGSDTDEWYGEAANWMEGEDLTVSIDVDGAPWPVRCSTEGLCMTVTNVGTVNAAATMMAVGLSPRLDLTKTYFMVAGIAGTTPQLGTTGSAAWAEWVVDGDLAHEIDPREVPPSTPYFRFRLGCGGEEAPWCEGWVEGTEVFHLNATLTEWAYQLTKDLELEDNERAQEYRANYAAHLPGAQPPAVMKCDALSRATYFHGKMMSEWASWWFKMWTGGEGDYCMGNMEDSGTLASLTRMSEIGRVDVSRVLVLRTASGFDQQFPGQTAMESLIRNHGGGALGLENAYRVGSAVAHYIIDNWDVWVEGVPDLPVGLSAHPRFQALLDEFRDDVEG